MGQVAVEFAQLASNRWKPSFRILNFDSSQLNKNIFVYSLYSKLTLWKRLVDESSALVLVDPELNLAIRDHVFDELVSDV